MGRVRADEGRSVVIPSQNATVHGVEHDPIVCVLPFIVKSSELMLS